MPRARGELASSTSVPPSVKILRGRRVISVEPEKEGRWSRDEKDKRHQWETVVRALTRTRNPLAETEGASLSQQIRMCGEKRCPEDCSAMNGFLADRRESRDRRSGGFTIPLASLREPSPILFHAHGRPPPP